MGLKHDLLFGFRPDCCHVSGWFLATNMIQCIIFLRVRISCLEIGAGLSGPSFVVVLQRWLTVDTITFWDVDPCPYRL